MLYATGGISYEGLSPAQRRVYGSRRRAVLLHAPPYKDPDSLTAVSEKRPAAGSTDLNVSGHESVAWRERNHTFRSIATFEDGNYSSIEATMIGYCF